MRDNTHRIIQYFIRYLTYKAVPHLAAVLRQLSGTEVCQLSQGELGAVSHHHERAPQLQYCQRRLQTVRGAAGRAGTWWRLEETREKWRWSAWVEVGRQAEVSEVFHTIDPRGQVRPQGARTTTQNGHTFVQRDMTLIT